MVGGVMGGYWASGRLTRAMAPARVMTMDSTVAKIGRSMKNRDMVLRAPRPNRACRFALAPTPSRPPPSPLSPRLLWHGLLPVSPLPTAGLPCLLETFGQSRGTVRRPCHNEGELRPHRFDCCPPLAAEP